MLNRQNHKSTVITIGDPPKGAAPKTPIMLFLSPSVLLPHPKNLRRVYPEDQVKLMAASIEARKGLKQAMQIVPADRPGSYYVVDGNMRLKGALLLGKECPPLKCELLSETEAEQLLTMVITSKVRFDPDPVSEAICYQGMIAEHSFTPELIARTTGLCVKTVENRLALLKLDTEIQDHIANRRLPSDVSVVEAFLTIPVKEARIKLAERLARDGVSIKAVVKSCERLAGRLKESEEETGTDCASAQDRVGEFLGAGNVSSGQKVKWKQTRAAARQMCSACDLKLSALSNVPEPAWSLIAHAIGDTCGGCEVRQIGSICGQCPAVMLLKNLIAGASEHAA